MNGERYSFILRGKKLANYRTIFLTEVNLLASISVQLPLLSFWTPKMIESPSIPILHPHIQMSNKANALYQQNILKILHCQYFNLKHLFLPCSLITQRMSILSVCPALSPNVYIRPENTAYGRSAVSRIFPLPKPLQWLPNSAINSKLAQQYSWPAVPRGSVYLCHAVWCLDMLSSFLPQGFRLEVNSS